ncbi:MAG TPA: L-arabinose isomerase [Gaiellaceae bacterium]|nr:L-arabinose isomerase [Gaiellaceae bacterium]
MPLGDREVWLVAGTQDLYGPTVIATVEDRVRRVAAALDASPHVPVRVRGRGAVRSSEEIERLCLEAGAAGACAGLVVWMHTFSPAKMWIAGLSALRVPLLHLHTQFARELPWAEIDMAYMNLNQSAHGDRELGFLLTRMGVRRATVAGHWDDPDLQRRIGDWSRAACGWHELQHLRVARFGDTMRRVAVTEGDRVEAQLRLGAAVNGYGVTELVEAVEDASGVGELVREYEESYDVAPDLRRGGERHDRLRDAARIELGLRAFLEARGVKAFTDTFEDLGGLRQLPGISVQRLMADGYGFGAEGDWKTAVLLRALKVMAAGRAGGTSFMEDYTYDLAGDGLVLGAHMLEVCPSLAAARPSCECHPLAIGGRDDPVRLVFAAGEGPAVNVALVDLGDRFRLLASEVDVVPPPEPLPRLPVAHAVWRPRPNLAAAAEAWLAAGGSHHTVLSLAVTPDVVRAFARIAGIELVEIS